eukprot:jgi/Mesen1/6057/ME000309S05193
MMSGMGSARPLGEPPGSQGQSLLDGNPGPPQAGATLAGGSISAQANLMQNLNLPILPFMMSSKLLPEMEASESATRDHRLALLAASHPDVTDQIVQLQCPCAFSALTALRIPPAQQQRPAALPPHLSAALTPIPSSSPGDLSLTLGQLAALRKAGGGRPASSPGGMFAASPGISLGGGVTAHAATPPGLPTGVHRHTPSSPALPLAGLTAGQQPSQSQGQSHGQGQAHLGQAQGQGPPHNAGQMARSNSPLPGPHLGRAGHTPSPLQAGSPLAGTVYTPTQQAVGGGAALQGGGRGAHGSLAGMGRAGAGGRIGGVGGAAEPGGRGSQQQQQPQPSQAEAAHAFAQAQAQALAGKQAGVAGRRAAAQTAQPQQQQQFYR